MDRRLKALLYAALLCATATLLACGDDAKDDPKDGSAAEDMEDVESTPLDAPSLAKLPKAPRGTANADDARIANEVLTGFASDRNVDARNFAIVVNDGVVFLMPSEDAEDKDIEYAEKVARAMKGVEDVQTETSADVAAALDEDAQDIVDAVHAAHADPSEDAEDADAETDDVKEEPIIDGAAELGKPTPKEDEEALEADDAPESDASEAQEDDAEEEEQELREYTLRRGDSLSSVASRKLGNGARWTEIYELNRDVIGPNPDGIRDGMVIKLPPRR